MQLWNAAIWCDPARCITFICYWHSTLNPILTRAEIKQCLYLQKLKIVDCRLWKFVACIHQKCFSLFLLKYFYNRGYLPRQNGSRFPIWSASPPTRSNIMFVAAWTEHRAPAPLKCLSLGFFLLLVSTEHQSFVYGIIWLRDRTLFFRIISDFTGSHFTLTFESPNSYDVVWHLKFCILSHSSDITTLGPVSQRSETFQAWGLFLESPKTFLTYFGCHIPLCIFKTKASRGTKLCSYFYFYSLCNIWKDQLCTISRS